MLVRMRDSYLTNIVWRSASLEYTIFVWGTHLFMINSTPEISAICLDILKPWLDMLLWWFAINGTLKMLNYFFWINFKLIIILNNKFSYNRCIYWMVSHNKILLRIEWKSYFISRECILSVSMIYSFCSTSQMLISCSACLTIWVCV